MTLGPTILRDSFELIIDRRPDLTVRFYVILFERFPALAPMFRRDRAGQARMLAGAIAAVPDHLDADEGGGRGRHLRAPDAESHAGRRSVRRLGSRASASCTRPSMRVRPHRTTRHRTLRAASRRARHQPTDTSLA